LAFEDVVFSFQKANDKLQKELDKFHNRIEYHIYLLEDAKTKF
jgi:ribosome-associated translation inhibitor RaiA